MAKPEEKIYDGLANVANAIRRSTALTVAMQVTEPDPEKTADQQVEEMLDRADELAVWLRGSVEDAPKPKREPLGEAFNP